MNRRADPQPPRAATGSGGPRVHLARIDAGGERGRGTWSLLLGALVLVVVAIAKPWGDGMPHSAAGSAGPAPGPATGAAVVIPTPTPQPTPLSADALAIARCNEPLGWRAYAWETWRGKTIRHFIALDPLVAPSVGGALDARIPVVPLISEAITAVGYCAPVSDPDPPPHGVTVTVWSVDAAGAMRAVPVVRIEPIQASGLMALFAYRVSLSEPGQQAAWPPGRYVFDIAGPPGSDWQRWFAVEVVEFEALSPP